MKTYRFWIAAVMSVSLHAGALVLTFLGGPGITRAELVEPYGDSDREGFDIGAVSVNPGTWRQGDQHTPGGDDAPESSPDDVEPLPLEAKPPEPTPLPALAVLPASSTTVAEKPTESSSAKNSPTSSTKTGLPGAAGGSDLAIGTPSKGGIVGKLTGVKYLGGGRKTYPAEAVRLGQEGRPLVWVRISEDGEVVESKLHQSSGYPLLDEAAVRYALTMKFRPARRGDTPVESTAIQPVRYELP